MDLVVDPNVIISATLNVGNSLIIFILNSITNKFNFIAPEYLIVELSKYTNELAERTSFSHEDVTKIISFIINQVTFIPEYKYQDKIEESRVTLKRHEKDIPYLALALKYNCDILSGDKTFKKFCPDKVRNPKEILNMFYSN